MAATHNPDGSPTEAAYDGPMSKMPRWIDLLAFAVALGLLLAVAVANAADYSE